MKKILLLSSVIAIMCACGSNGTNNNDNASNSEDSVQAQETVAEATADQPENAAEESSEENCYILEEFKTEYQPLYASFKVKGEPNVQSFVESLPVYNPEYGWYTDPEIDKKNGYFHYFEEGSGHVSFDGAVWNRKDGKKLFILSYDECDWYEHKGHDSSFCLKGGSKYYYVGAYAFEPNDDGSVSFIDYITGCVAYLYNTDTKTLEYLSEPPFNGWKGITTRCQFKLPQHGKDIIVREGYDVDGEELPQHTLKWNGMTFDYID